MLALPATPTLQAWRQGSRSAHRQEVHSAALLQGGPAQPPLPPWQPRPGSGSGFAERGAWPPSRTAGPAHLAPATLAGSAPVESTGAGAPRGGSPAAGGALKSGAGLGSAAPEEPAPLGDPAAAAERALAALQAANAARHAELDWRAQNGMHETLNVLIEEQAGLGNVCTRACFVAQLIWCVNQQPAA